MLGIFDKWDTKFLRTLMCHRVTSRPCLTSSRMQRTVWCNRMDTGQSSGYSVRFLEFQVICWRRTLIYPIGTPEGRFRRIAEMRHKCWMAAIETEGECKDQKEFDWTIETHARKLRAWRSGVLLASRIWCTSSTRSVAGTSSGHRN